MYHNKILYQALKARLRHTGELPPEVLEFYNALLIKMNEKTIHFTVEQYGQHNTPTGQSTTRKSFFVSAIPHVRSLASLCVIIIILLWDLSLCALRVGVHEDTSDMSPTWALLVVVRCISFLESWWNSYLFVKHSPIMCITDFVIGAFSIIILAPLLAPTTHVVQFAPLLRVILQLVSWKLSENRINSLISWHLQQDDRTPIQRIVFLLAMHSLFPDYQGAIISNACLELTHRYENIYVDAFREDKQDEEVNAFVKGFAMNPVVPTGGDNFRRNSVKVSTNSSDTGSSTHSQKFPRNDSMKASAVSGSGDEPAAPVRIIGGPISDTVQVDEDHSDDDVMLKSNGSNLVSRYKGSVAYRYAHWPPTETECIQETPMVATNLGNSVTGWDFNVFTLHDTPLFHVGVNIFRRCELDNAVHEGTMGKFLLMLGKGYGPTPYHNEHHAADVVQSTYSLLERCGVWWRLTPLERLSVVVAAAIHDVGHPGKSNGFMSATCDELAFIYNDKSILENYHCKSGFALLRSTSEVDVTSKLSEDEYRIFRKIVVNLVLSTDMTDHTTLITTFRQKKLSLESALAAEDAKLLLLKVVMHAADVSNPAKRSDIAAEWARRVMAEFSQQGHEEARHGLPISPFCDASANTAKCQIGFIKFVVKPLFEALIEFNEEAFRPMIDHLDGNVSYWTAKLAEESSERSDEKKNSRND
eukprot:PhF_6_TR32183/c0_g1_i1/m.47779/K13755/PDE1; calcium/calmodulin-dependent 3',5'-cyclic nucleotide phosphodiesterase